MTIQKEFFVRYRSAGHVRFQIPACATQPQAAERLSVQLAGIQGVQTVKLFRSTRKLSIRYDESELSFIQLAQQLHTVLTQLAQQGVFESTALAQTQAGEKTKRSLKARWQASRLQRWFDGKVTAAKETAQAAKVLGKIGSKGPKALFNDPEKAITDFLTDMLVIYLIKIHWNRITQQWLVKPFVHRYEWLATFYLFYLLVRSRRPK